MFNPSYYTAAVRDVGMFAVSHKFAADMPGTNSQYPGPVHTAPLTAACEEGTIS